MSRTFFSVENLEPPFLRVLEKSFLLPTKGRTINSKGQKIVFVLGGEAEHNFAGQSPQRVGCGDILVVPVRGPQFYNCSVHPTRLHALCLFFDVSTLPLLEAGQAAASPGDPEQDVLGFCRHHFQRNVHLPGACDAVFFETLGQLRQEAEQRGPGYRLRISALCSSLTVMTARLLVESGRQRSKGLEQRGSSYLVSRAKEYLQANYAQEIHFPQLARHLLVSEEHLSRCFKQMTGSSVFAYLRVLRLEQAKNLLLNSNLNVSEIARTSGFRSLALFSRKFKLYTGLTPLEYRREFGGNSAP